MTQTGLADATGIDQQTISKYARGAVTPPLEAVEALEDACGLARGHILRLAGFVSDDVDVRSAIASAEGIDEDGREMVLGAYDYARRAATGSARAALAEAGERIVDEMIANGEINPSGSAA